MNVQRNEMVTNMQSLYEGLMSLLKKKTSNSYKKTLGKYISNSMQIYILSSKCWMKSRDSSLQMFILVYKGVNK